MSAYFYTIALLILVFVNNTLFSSDNERELWESAKKELAQRTREYIRQNPISEELQAFIEQLKRPKRKKRQDHNNMYAIKDGEIVPLAKLEEHLRAESNFGDNFTVVPLIIPIPLQTVMTLKERNDATGRYDSSYNSGGSEKAILGRGEAMSIAKSRRKENKGDESEESGTEETVVDNLIEDKMKSTTESSELSKVLEDVQDLIIAQKKGKSSSKEGALCNVSGHWDSESGGMTFHIKKTDNGADISMRAIEPPSEDGFIAKAKWNVTARVPFPQSAQVIITLTAHKGRRVALFLGECRVCDGSETITGDWLVGRTSNNCKDQKASHSFISDVLRKNNIDTLREAHMKKLSTMTTTPSTEPT